VDKIAPKDSAFVFVENLTFQGRDGCPEISRHLQHTDGIMNLAQR